MKNFLMMPLLAFALFACESNETENGTSLDEIESSVNEANLSSWLDKPDTVTFDAVVTEIRDWDGVVMQYSTLESEFDGVETRWYEVEAETDILELGDTITITDAFIDPDSNSDILHFTLIPYKVVGDEEGQLYEYADEEISIINGFALSNFTYEIEFKTAYSECCEN